MSNQRPNTAIAEWEIVAKSLYNAAKIGIDAAKTYRVLLEAAFAKRPVRLNDVDRARKLLDKADEIYQQGREARLQLMAGGAGVLVAEAVSLADARLASEALVLEDESLEPV